MQLVNKAASGDLPALRAYVGRHEIGLEKEALLEAAQASKAERYKNVKNLTDEELEEMIAGLRKDEE
jgi:hypothetical protein